MIIRRLLVLGVLGASVSGVLAQDRMPQKDGWSGFLQLGWSYNGIKNNEIAGVSGGSWDEFTRETIDSIFDSPEETTEGLPALNFQVNYVFKSRTQLFLGQDLIDAARFDMSQTAGVRQEFADKSHLALAYVFSAAPTKVWEDPFVEGVPRGKTDRASKGVRLSYGRILGSNAQFRYTFREIDIDDERSGEWLGLTPNEISQLERDGKQHNVLIGYRFDFGKAHSLFPELVYNKGDRDGDAVNSDEIGLKVAYAYGNQRFNFVATGLFTKAEYDERHPIYNQTRDDDRWGLGAIVFDKQLLSRFVKNWWATASAGYYKEDSNIAFYDTTFWTMGAGVMYRF